MLFRIAKRLDQSTGQLVILFLRISVIVIVRAETEQFDHLLRTITRVLDAVSSNSRVRVHLVVVAALERLVAEEMDRLVLDTIGSARLGLDVLQAICLVPSGGEDVERDLAAY